MRRNSDWLIPRFLKRWDRFLLEHYPSVWETRIHFVLFYGLLVFILLFVAGLLYPVSLDKLTVDPIKPIHINLENPYKIFSVFAIITIFIWGRQYYLFHQTAPFKSSLVQPVLYAIGIFILLGLDTSAFRLGTVVRTAFFLMSEKHIQKAKEKRFYIYGFILHDQELPQDSLDLERYFNKGEELLWEYRLHEDAFLKNRYNRAFFKDFFSQALKSEALDSSNFIIDFFIKEHSNLLYQVEKCYLSVPSRLYALSELSFMLEYPDSLTKIKSSLIFRNIKTPSKLNEGWYHLFRSNQSYLLYRAKIFMGLHTISNSPSNKLREQYLSDVILTSHYYSYFQSMSKDTNLFVDNNISMQEIDTLYSLPQLVRKGDIFFTFPKHPFILENAVRSIEHARQYLKEGVILRHYESLLLHLPLIVVLFFSIPFLSYAKGLGTLLIYSALSIGFNFFDGTYYLNNELLFAFPFLAFLALLIFVLKQRQQLFAFWIFHFILCCLLIILLLALLGVDEEWKILQRTLDPFSKTKTINRPNNLAFFGVEIIGLAAILLMAYISRLPKSA